MVIRYSISIHSFELKIDSLVTSYVYYNNNDESELINRRQMYTIKMIIIIIIIEWERERERALMIGEDILE